MLKTRRCGSPVLQEHLPPRLCWLRLCYGGITVTITCCLEAVWQISRRAPGHKSGGTPTGLAFFFPDHTQVNDRFGGFGHVLNAYPF